METCHHGAEPGAPRADYCLICNLKRAFLMNLAMRARHSLPPARFEKGEPSEEGVRAMAELIVQGLVRDEIDAKSGVVFVITRAGAEAAR